MLNKIKKSKDEGFTIIEVMIVLAIAGLIMLIVFMAIPALQRNQRNTTAKSEASNIMAAVTEYSTNNGGKLPGSGDAATIITGSKVKNIETLRIEPHSSGNAPSSTEAVLKTGAKCVSTSPVAGLVGGSAVVTQGASRQSALIFATESSAGDTTSCVES